MSRLKLLGCPARFLAVSATFPNVEDVGRWLGGGGVNNGVDPGDEQEQAVNFNFTEEYRPVQLNRVVIGKTRILGRVQAKISLF